MCPEFWYNEQVYELGGNKDENNPAMFHSDHWLLLTHQEFHLIQSRGSLQDD